MTDPSAVPQPENVARGLTFTLLVIPFAVVASTLVGIIFGIGFFTGFVAVGMPTVASYLYLKGAGAPLTKPNAVGWVAISLVAIVVSIFTGIVAGAWNGFAAVSGDGGVFGSAFLRTVINQFTVNFDDTLIPIAIGLGLGVVSLVSVLNGPKAGRGNRLTPEQTDALTDDTAASATPAVPIAPATQPIAPPARPIANQPSPGILLNGKPLDPDKR